MEIQKMWNYLPKNKSYLFTFILLIALVNIFVFKIISSRAHQPLTSKQGLQVQKTEGKDLSQMQVTKMILFFTPLFNQKPWMDVDSTKTFLTDCPDKKCVISYDENKISKSDLAIFHAADMPTIETLEYIHKHRSSNQRMAYLSHESPPHTPDVSPMPSGFFNWTITFKRTSDFTIPYGHCFPLHPEDKPSKVINYALGKIKLVAWAVSNCGKIRDKYVHELLKHIKIDVYGGCSGVFGQNNQCPRSSSQCDELFKTYKFYLAFENSLCTDYITEKFWRTLHWGVVPIVLKTDDYSRVAPPYSFISVQDFSSVRALADYLLYLDSNDTAYNEYFHWRNTFNAAQKHWFRFVACDMCDALHDGNVSPKWYDLKSFWNAKTDCEEPEIPLLKLIEKSNKF